MRNLKLTIAYDGTDFHGWQSQPGLKTIQGALEDAVEQITGYRSTSTASGRTDAGVHALAQVAHLHSPTRLSLEVLARGLNALLPSEIRVLDISEVPQAFHATLDARSKRYRYLIDNSQPASPFLLRYAWHIPRPLDVHAMHASGQALRGRHDFRSFETNWPNRTSAVRTIFDLQVEREGARVALEVEADGFLYNMVRAIAGTLVLVGSGNREINWPQQVLESQSRVAAGPNAPPNGLYLLLVRYADDPGPPAQTSSPDTLIHP